MTKKAVLLLCLTALPPPREYTIAFVGLRHHIAWTFLSRLSQGEAGHGGPSRDRAYEQFFVRWLTDPVQNGAGALIDFGSYNAAWAVWYKGRPESVFAYAHQLRPERFPKVDDTAVMVLNYKDGVGILEGSWDFPRGIQDLEVFGPAGSLRTVQDREVVLRKAREPEVKLEAPALPSEMAGATQYLAHCLTNGRPVEGLVSLDVNVGVMEVLEAAKLSLETGRSVALPLAQGANQLTPEEQKAGWRLLFDGRTTTGWRGGRWQVRDGCLRPASVAADSRGGNDLVSEDIFGDFDLRWEWRVGPRGNSGIKYFVVEERGRPIGHEYQMLDDAGYGDEAKAIQRTGALYDLVPPASGAAPRPAGEWNQSRIVVRGLHVEHWLNGLKAVEYEFGSPQLMAAVARSKFKDVAGFGARREGRLLLQDHEGGEVCFRNVKILAR